MLRYFLAVTIVLSALCCLGQSISGRVIDAQSKAPIPFVSIGEVGSNNATISNENGEFYLKGIKLPARIRYSHVSYQVLEQQFSSNPNDIQTISLTPALVNLAEVSIDPYLGQRLLKAAIEHTNTQHSKTAYAKAFYRQLTTVNGKASQIYELFYSLKFNAMGVQAWLAKQSRFAEQKERFSFSMNNQSYLTFSFAASLFENKKTGVFVNLKNLKNYKTQVERYIEQNGQNIAVISCKYNGSRKKHYANATYYVGTEDKNIYRIESSLFNLPLRHDGASESIPPICTIVATFNNQNPNLPYVESVATKLQIGLRAQNQKIEALVSSLLSLYQLDTVQNTQNYQSLNRKTQDKEVIESISYDPNFWKNNPIVKQTALADAFIKMMESKSAFGTMIPSL